MNLFKTLFGGKEEEVEIRTYHDFWKWFAANERAFFEAVKCKDAERIERLLFDKLTPKLSQLKEGFFFLAGMAEENTAELVFTADGNFQNMVFVEELVAAAPEIPGWLFTAHKQPNLDGFALSMRGYEFSLENLGFCAPVSPGYPDEVAVSIIHDDFTEKRRVEITGGVYVFLDNFLGELNFATGIDELNIISRAEAQGEVLPISALPAYLEDRKSHFIEKYEGIRQNTDDDNYNLLEAQLENGDPLIALVNARLLEWDGKPSHPWMVLIELNYGYKHDQNGMPDSETSALLVTIEEDLTKKLPDFEGYLNIGRATANGTRTIFLACKDFRAPSKVLYETQQALSGKIPIEYRIIRDKYWKSVECFRPASE